MAGAEIFTGSVVAMVTPFFEGAVDHESAAALVAWQIEEGTSAILISGTTGESPTLTEDERVALLETAIRAVDGRVPVIAGTGSNNTAHAIESSRRAQEAGADGLLLVTPYYNKPNQAGLLGHYRAIADAVRLPICLYSVPGRTGVAIAPETVAALARHERIVALKEAGGNVDRVSEIRQLTDITILSGDDPLALPMMAVGAKGVISVTANVAPRAVAGMVRDLEVGRFEQALAAHESLYPLSRAMFFDTNPIPVKTALAMMGKVREEFRLPLVRISAENRARLASVMTDFGLQPSA